MAEFRGPSLIPLLLFLPGRRRLVLWHLPRPSASSHQCGLSLWSGQRARRAAGEPHRHHAAEYHVRTHTLTWSPKASASLSNSTLFFQILTKSAFILGGCSQELAEQLGDARYKGTIRTSLFSPVWGSPPSRKATCFVWAPILNTVPRPVFPLPLLRTAVS